LRVFKEDNMACCRLLALTLCVALTGCGSLLLPSKLQPLEESVVFGDRGPKIVQLEVQGVITESPRRTRLALVPPESMLARVKEALNRAERDRDVVALLLRIQSPGGTVSASETLYHEILSWKERTGRPVVAHLEGLATSGAYYAAMAADEIVAHPTTVTGSIGVIFAGLNFAGLMEKVGITNQTLTGGEFKDSGSPFRPMRKAERAQLQSVIDDFYGRFREVVEQGRPQLEPAAVERLSDGRIFSARQALEHRLVDQIGYVQDSVATAEKWAGIETSRVVVYHRPREFRNNLYSGLVTTPHPLVDVDLLPAALEPLPPGFYFLWPEVLDH
jgi:protease-4